MPQTVKLLRDRNTAGIAFLINAGLGTALTGIELRVVPGPPRGAASPAHGRDAGDGGGGGAYAVSHDLR